MASEEPLFDPSLKKRKKKTVAFTEDPLGADADPTTPAPTTIDATTTNGDAVDLGPTTLHEQMKQSLDGDAADGKEEDDFKTMFPEGLKKKKKKKDIPMDLGDEESGTSTPTVAAATEDLDFSDLKKKKKSSKKKAMEDFEKELNDSKANIEGDEEADDGAHLNELDDADLGDDPFARGAEAPTGIDSGSEPWLSSDRDYTYPELLQRFYASLHASNPALLMSTGKRYTIAPPQILREGNKRSIFANVADICKRMHRQPEHVIQFMFAEMGTTGSVDGSGRLVIKGRFQPKQIENVLRRYIVEYVTCKTCKSPDTLLTKENRIFFMSCESCGSRRSVNAIKSGFQAQVGKRSKNKAK
ncbi:eukaryotic translation initiation factor 2 beta [Coniophora puteana RWD-64-598 SS2]|uniref:Eukaryotic translation initiation factor 2 beta n=1 Tax=Coniophora puteana (strain RWD-64-598) TaxID=741705 RepID=A0A5M3MK71_CONPW|nr:eukaryotic translation initiation factor 2 beta [Coniophora puteana RWD-64-598 SS2]EIW79628.1 eukaryotic translation initiation factor 2 beta [Coniophora puteana RWD-64-598 SS2]